MKPDAVATPPMPDRQAAEALVALHKLIAVAGWQPVVGRTQGIRADGTTFDAPYPVYASEVHALVKAAAAPCWQVVGYDPVSAVNKLRNPQFVRTAALADMPTLLTVFVRGERFVDGFWAGEITDGTIQRVLERLETLLADPAIAWAT